MIGAFKLIWVAVVVTAHGPQVVPFIDETPFKADAECVAFGEKMKDRTSDFVRGMFDIRWDAPVRVYFKCEPNGQPT